MSAFVYFLPHASEPRFKIGKAIDVGARLRQLGKQLFDLGRCTAVQVASDHDALNLEKMLHRAFAQWRVPKEAVAATEGARTDGDTEWFQLNCFERLRQFLDHSEDIFCFSRVDSLEFARLIALPSAEADGELDGKGTRNRKPRLTREERIAAAQAARQAAIPLVKEAVRALLPHLTRLKELCSDLKFCRTTGTLCGCVSGVNYEAAAETIHTMHGEILPIPNAGIWIINSYQISGGERAGATFSLFMMTPAGEYGELFWHNFVGAELALLPFDVPGWRA